MAFGPLAALIEVLFVFGVVGCVTLGVSRYRSKRKA